MVPKGRMSVADPGEDFDDDGAALDALVSRRSQQARRLTASQARRRIVLWHRTTAKSADLILKSGFRDGAGPYMTKDVHRGVWLSNRPLNPNEGTLAGPLLRVSVAMRVTQLVEYEWMETGKPYREFLIPAAVLNPRARMVIVDEDDHHPSSPGHTRIVLERIRRRRPAS